MFARLSEALVPTYAGQLNVKLRLREDVVFIDALFRSVSKEHTDVVVEMKYFIRPTGIRMRVSEAVSSYIVNLVRQTRQHAAVWVGAGPRATLALLSASRALAALEERDFVLPEDVKTLAWNDLVEIWVNDDTFETFKTRPRSIEVLRVSVVGKVAA